MCLCVIRVSATYLWSEKGGVVGVRRQAETGDE